jgi:RHS repeat-associated protein
VVERDHPQINVNLTYIQQTGDSNANTDGGDKYTGLDRFGRVIDRNWLNTSTGTSTDRFQYGYDRDSNVLWRNNLVNTAFGELYSYDNLNQLSSFERGTLNSTKTGLTGSASRTQSWSPDAVGNFSSITTDGAQVNNTVNKLNEETGVGSATLTYDANGNMTTDQAGNQFVYDAWNRLVTVKDSSGTALESFNYDGLSHRITLTASGTTTDLYYSASWQVLEERVGGVATAQYGWSPVYVDAMILRDRSVSGGTLNERLLVQQDANWNVTAVVNSSGSVVEREVYDPYGSVSFLTNAWTTEAASAYLWTYDFQGGRFDIVSGLYNYRNRNESPTLGRWEQMDPIGFGGNDIDLFRYASDNPAVGLDPTGQADFKLDFNPADGPKFGKWGGFYWTGNWKVTPPPGKTCKGVIIQYIELHWKIPGLRGVPALLKFNGINPTTGKPDGGIPYPTKYYEAWEVDAKGNADPSFTPGFAWTDHGWKLADMPNQKYNDFYGLRYIYDGGSGSFEFDGKARYFDGLTMDQLKKDYRIFKRDTDHNPTPAGGALASLPAGGEYVAAEDRQAAEKLKAFWAMNPPGSDDVPHNMKVKWNDNGKTE